MSETRTIRGRIIRILDTTTVIINLGRKNGVTPQSIFRILGDPETIEDPASGEVLGSLTVVKAKARASQVYERFTIATSKWTTRSSPAYGLLGMEPAYGLLGMNILKDQVVEHGEELRVDPNEVKPWRAESEAPVQLGDEIEVSVPISEEAAAEDESSERTELDAIHGDSQQDE